MATDRYTEDDNTRYDWSAWENFGKGARAASLNDGSQAAAPAIQSPKAGGLLSSGFAREIANATRETERKYADKNTEGQSCNSQPSQSLSQQAAPAQHAAQAPRQSTPSAPRTLTRLELKAANDKGRKDGLASKCTRYETYDDMALATQYHEGFREAADFLGANINSIGWYLERHNAAKAYKQALEVAASQYCGRGTSDRGVSTGSNTNTGGSHGQANTYAPAPANQGDDLSLPPIPTPPWLAKSGSGIY